MKRPKRITNAQVGMFVLLASFTMLFGTLLLSYLLIRARQSIWPPIGVNPLDKQISTVSTMVVVLSSVAFAFSIRAWDEGLVARARRYWAAGLATGLGFVALQAFFLRDMWKQGLRVADGLFSSINYTLIIIHGIHVLAAFIPLLLVSYKFSRSTLRPGSELPELVSWFWHFLGGVWVVTYLLLVWY